MEILTVLAIIALVAGVLGLGGRLVYRWTHVPDRSPYMGPERRRTARHR